MSVKKQEVECCVVSCEKPLDEKYWNDQYAANATGWDLGAVSPPIAQYIDSIADKSISILIPGCGNAHEAAYLIEKGFTNVTVIDIAPLAVESLKTKFRESSINIILGDFFLHEGNYDLIIEQTFFCALPPSHRRRYVYKMHSLLNNNGVLAGLLFNRSFEISPPFGGNKEEYDDLFAKSFHFEHFDVCNTSIAPRKNTELWMKFRKNSEVKLSLFTFEGITCSGCIDNVKASLSSVNNFLHITVSPDFSEALVISSEVITARDLNAVLGESSKYKVKEA
jgi:SAM-dependent methyltransferase